MEKPRLSYDEFRELLKEERLPAALVNLDALDVNSETIFNHVRGTGKTLRIASKSVRSPAILQYIMEKDPTLCRGLMCFSLEEAAFLCELGFDDLLIAYPSIQSSDMKILGDLTSAGKRVMQIVDCKEHIDALASAGRAANTTCSALVDIDVSYRPLGSRLHIGVRRSPIRKAEAVIDLYRYAEKQRGVRVIGVMGYEAQIAGLTDKNPFTRTQNPIKRIIKSLSVRDVASCRLEMLNALSAEGIRLEVVNGGGTGSIKYTTKEDVVTEVTAGSGFFCPHLFSYYHDLDLLPAAFFALQVVRASGPGYVTCQGGGYIASGETGRDRQPVVYLPEGCKLTSIEGAGEVQTPIIAGSHATELKIGDPVIMRHAKAGELCERFNELVLIANGKITGRVPTYRGLGRCFL